MHKRHRKAALTSPPILRHLDENVPTTVTKTAPATALVQLPFQTHCDSNVVIEFTSRVVMPAVKVLRSNVCEATTMHWAVPVKFLHHLIRRKLHLLNDHCTVTLLTTTVKPPRRFTSILIDLLELDFSVSHKSGRQNFVADIMLLRPCYSAMSSFGMPRELQRADPRLQ